MIKITIETPDGVASKVRKDGQLVSCFVDVCRALEVSDDQLKEAFKTVLKDEPTSNKGKDKSA